jgi:para-aminobenzoate synthetase component 1
VIHSLIEKNGLKGSVASVKIILAQGPTGSGPHERTAAVIAKEYRPRSAPAGLRLATYAHRRHSPLASHKSMNYLYYKLAGDWARKRGSDEALIVNADGTASESNTANVFGRRGGEIFFLTSDHVLPGTTEARVRTLLDGWGIAHAACRLTPEDLCQSDELYLCNALIGVVPVQSLDERDFRVESALAERLTQALFFGEEPPAP